VCQYVKQTPNVLVLELLDNDITKLGCEFISKILMPAANTCLQVLKLDHNNFGSEGIKYLSEGLCMNKTITHVSLTYCNIDSAGARPILEFLIYQ